MPVIRRSAPTVKTAVAKLIAPAQGVGVVLGAPAEPVRHEARAEAQRRSRQQAHQRPPAGGGQMSQVGLGRHVRADHADGSAGRVQNRRVATHERAPFVGVRLGVGGCPALP